MSTAETIHTHADAPALLIEAADTIGNRAAERALPGVERAMARTVHMFNLWRGQNHDGVITEQEGWMFMVFLKLARAAEGKHRRDDYIDGAAYLALACECVERDAIPF